MTDCTPVGVSGTRCLRAAEVRVHLINTDGSTQSRSQVCAVHGIQSATLAFADETKRHAPCTVVLAPLGEM